MKLKRKKRGSTFLIVIITMFLMFITGTSILSITANGYKMRKNENERLKNLYEADSGLNGVENIIIKTSEQAISYADNEVKKQISILKDTKSINKLFKDKFYEYLTKEVDYNYQNNNKIEIIKYLIINKKYIDRNEEGSIIYKDSEIEKDVVIDVPKDGYEFSEDGISIEVQSTFESKEEDVKNKKIVSITYKIKSPEYNGKISNVAIYPVFDNKALTVDGDLSIDTGETGIVGDIWVKGNDPIKNSTKYIFDKYNGGIYVKESTLNIKGDVISANTLQLSHKSKFEVDGKVYAKNIYLGKKFNDLVSEDNNLKINGDVIVNNDLTMNSEDSIIEINGNFYGINDKTTEGSTVEKALNSSSIIVNDISGTSNVTVNKDSYIMGVAYLNATNEDEKYQTGESVAVKGNYLSYGDVENIENKIILKYYNPLQLLESINGDSSLEMKAKYFTEYFNNPNDKKYSLKDGGVDLKGEVYSVGASIIKGSDNQSKVQGVNISENLISIINNQRNIFTINVLTMGDATGISNLKDIYSKQDVFRTVNNQIDFEKIKNSTSKFNVGNEGTVILIGDKTKLFINEGKVEGTNITINKGLIITNGDIEIKGGFNFTGCIITTGNVTMADKNSIIYDSNVIRSIIGENEDLLSEIFETEKSIKKSEETKITPSSNIYGTDTFLNKSSWKIVK